MKFTLLNGPKGLSAPEDPTSQPFTLSAEAGTDVWRTPKNAGARDSFDGTILATRLPLKYFKLARVTVSADWKHQYQQGGLIFYLLDGPTSSASAAPKKWIKAGIELDRDELWAAVVAADPYSDWSLMPWGKKEMTIEMEWEKNYLWIYALPNGLGGKRIPLRQVTWVFEDEGKECMVGCAVAMPKPGAEGEVLEVSFKDFVVETR